MGGRGKRDYMAEATEFPAGWDYRKLYNGETFYTSLPVEPRTF